VAFIYALVDPRTREVRYVGKANEPSSRLRVHIRSGDLASFSPRERWIGGLAFFDLEPELLLLEETDTWQEAERRWIALFRAISCDLTNSTDGGEGVRSGRHSPETRAKIADALRGRKYPPERVARSAAGRRGLPLSAATRAKMSAARRGVKRSPETVAKMRAANLGKKLSVEHRAKIGVASLGRIPSPEARAKMSAARLGKTRGPMSVEQKAKISAAMRARG